MTKQTQGILNLQQICIIGLKLGQIMKNVEIFVFENYLHYILIRIPQCKDFLLNFDCVNSIIKKIIIKSYLQ